MRFKLIWVILIGLFISGCAGSHHDEQPTVVNGVLDLTNWDYINNGPVALTGDWEFYWQRLIFPEDFNQQADIKPDGWISVPGIWNDVTMKGKKLGGKGFGTYRLLIKLNKDFATFDRESDSSDSAINIDHPILQVGFLTRFIESASSFYVNGFRIGGTGIVGQDAETSSPGYKPQLIRAPISSDQIEIIIQVSNFDHRKGGLDYTIYFGKYSDVLRKQRNSVIIDIFVFSAILIMGLYHFGLFLLRRTDRSTLYFGIFCLSIALRTTIANDSLFLTFFPEINWRFFLVLDYASFTFALPSVLLFFYTLFPEEINRTILKIIVIISGLYMVFVCATPPRIFSESVVPFQALIIFSIVYFAHGLIKAIRKKRSGSGLAMVGAAILIIATANDILHNNLIIHTALLFQFGVLGMILVQAFLLSVRFSRAFVEVENLKNSLEQKVGERTVDLRAALEKINHQSQEQKELIHILCHDLANPFNNLAALLELRNEDPSLFEELEDMMRISINSGLDTIDLVRQMRALEDKPHTLDVKKENLLEMISDSKSILGKRISDKQISLEIKVDANHHVMVERTSFVNSVLNNVFSNAIKFSPEGEKISIASKQENDTVILSIQDNGIGMSENLVNDLFDFSKSTSRPGIDGEVGTGFGMPLVKKFTEAYQGKLEVKSKEKTSGSVDHGTELIFTLIKG